MPDEGTTDAAATATTATADAQPIPLVNSEGELREGWRDTLPEEIRGDKVFDRVSNFQNVMKSLASAEKAFGKDKIVRPNEASSEADWDAFYVAGGRPETAADYNLKRPEELAEEHYNQELANAAQELFHKIGLSQKQADALFAFNNNNVIATLAKSAQDAELEAIALKDGLYAKWGNAYKQREHFGNAAVEGGTMGDVEFKERLLSKFGNDPDFIEYCANIGITKFKEAGSPIVETIPTPGAIQEQIDNEQANKAYGLDYAKHGYTKKQHKAQVEKVQDLYRERDKHLKTGFVEAAKK